MEKKMESITLFRAKGLGFDRSFKRFKFGGLCSSNDESRSLAACSCPLVSYGGSGFGGLGV